MSSWRGQTLLIPAKGSESDGGTPPFSGSDFRDSNVSSGNAASRTVTKPTGTIDGDLLVAVVSVGSGATVVTPPTGFTQIAGSPLTMADASVLRVYTKIASGEGASHVWGLAPADDCTVVEAAYAGPVTNATPEVKSTVTDFGTTSIPVPTITPTDANQWVVWGVGAGGTRTITGPGGSVNFRDTGTTQAAALADQFFASPSATGTTTFTVNSNSSVAGFAMAFSKLV